MSTEEVLCRHFSRMGARLRLNPPLPFQGVSVRIDVRNDRRGEYFDVRCRNGLLPEVVDVRPDRRHLMMLVREDRFKYKYLLGFDERHWFAAAVPGDWVRDVNTAIASLRPAEVSDRQAIRQGEWFFVPEPALDGTASVIHRNEPLTRGAGSKPHVCAEVTRRSGTAVMVSRRAPAGITLAEYERLVASDPTARNLRWERRVRDAEVFARGAVRHSDHKTVYLDGWHRVYMNRERYALNALQIAFLD